MGIRERKEREKKQRIDQILRAARKVFFEKGYSAATIEEIAKEAELSQATIYLYFKSKDDLYTTLILPGLEYMAKKLTQIEKKNNQDVVQDLEDMWEKVCLSFYRKYRYELLIILIIQQFGILNSISPEQKERINSLGRYNYDKIRQIMKKHLETGKIIEVDPRALPDLIWGMFAAAVQITESKANSDKSEILRTNMANYLEVLKRGLIKN